jgi:soluble lytic murein transglycosylase
MKELFQRRDWRGVDALLASGAPLSPLDLSLAANARWFQDRWAESLVLLEKSAPAWPAEVKPYGMLTTVLALERANRREEARKLALRLLTEAPGDLGYYAAYALFRLADESDFDGRGKYLQRMYSMADNNAQRATALTNLLKLPGNKTAYALNLTNISPRNSAALKVLEALPKPWSPDVNMAVGYAAYLRGQYDKAIPLFRAIPMDSIHGRKSRYYRAFSLYSQRQYSGALEAWSYLAKNGTTYAESSIRRISILAGRAEKERALRVLREVATSRDGAIQVRAYYSLSTHLSGNEKTEAENKVIELAPDSLFTTQILWRRGWSRWNSGDVRGAVREWEKSLVPAMNRNWRPRVLYWIAKGFGTLNETAKRDAHIRQLHKDHPLSIYAFISGGDKIDIQPGDPPELASKERSALEEWGFISHARRVLLAKGDPRSIYRAALLAEWMGDQQAVYSAVGRLSEQIRRGPVFYRRALSFLFPRPFQSEVSRAAERFKVEDNLLWSIMRQESAFNPNATSWVGASGLMQLMPATARSEAKALEMKSYNVYNPGQNIVLGTAHIARLLRSFGDVEQALAAYNAGGGNARRWLAERKNVPLDEWIESVRFEETNDYVQKVMANLHIYRTLYAPSLLKPGDAQVLGDVPDEDEEPGSGGREPEESDDAPLQNDDGGK